VRTIGSPPFELRVCRGLGCYKAHAAKNAGSSEVITDRDMRSASSQIKNGGCVFDTTCHVALLYRSVTLRRPMASWNSRHGRLPVTLR